jgi:hypothetical protein
MRPAKLCLPQTTRSVSAVRAVFAICSMTTKTLAFGWSAHRRLVATGIAVSRPAMSSVRSSAERRDALILGNLCTLMVIIVVLPAGRLLEYLGE